jgi:hypothetical protein
MKIIIGSYDDVVRVIRGFDLDSNPLNLYPIIWSLYYGKLLPFYDPGPLPLECKTLLRFVYFPESGYIDGFTGWNTVETHMQDLEESVAYTFDLSTLGPEVTTWFLLLEALHSNFRNPSLSARLYSALRSFWNDHHSILRQDSRITSGNAMVTFKQVMS